VALVHCIYTCVSGFSPTSWHSISKITPLAMNFAANRGSSGYLYWHRDDRNSEYLYEFLQRVVMLVLLKQKHCFRTSLQVKSTWDLFGDVDPGGCHEEQNRGEQEVWDFEDRMMGFQSCVIHLLPVRSQYHFCRQNVAKTICEKNLRDDETKRPSIFLYFLEKRLVWGR
jgi:hypothetical protein